MMSSLAVVADTLLVRQVPQVRSGFEQVVFVSAGVSQVVTLVVVVLLAIIFFRMWKTQQALQEQLGHLAGKVDPMIASATEAAANVRVLTDVVRRDAVQAAEALREATGRVRDSVGAVADRVDDFSALLGRVHARADAAADVAGVALDALRQGVRAMRHDDADEESPYAEDSPAPQAAPRRRKRRRRGGSGGGPRGGGPRGGGTSGGEPSR